VRGDGKGHRSADRYLCGISAELRAHAGPLWLQQFARVRGDAVNDRIGELLVKENLLTKEQLRDARANAKGTGNRLGSEITKMGLLDESELADFVAKQYGVPSINLDEFEIDRAVIELVPEEVAIKHNVIPVNRAGSTLILATSDPSNIFALDDIKFLTGYNIQPVVASEEAIRRAVDRYYDKTSSLEDVMGDFDDSDIDLIQESDEIDAAELAKASEDAPVVKLVNLILTDAVKKNASDIHIEPYEKSFRVRYRIDGVLYEVMKPPMKLKNAITSRVKIMSELDIAERRLPQDGRIKLKLGRGKEMDFRVSVLPTLFGEKVVMRLLDKGNLQLDMTKLGFEQSQLDVFKRSIHLPYGMVLVTGPPARARRPRSTPRSRSSTRPARTSPPRRIRSSSTSPASTRCRCTTRSGSTSRRVCARSCARTPTSSWSARSATSRPPRSRSRPRSPATWCSRRSTPTTRRRPSTACSTWASSRSWSRPRSTASWPSGSRAACAPSARRPTTR
jgi:hypothetical protein